MSADTSPVPGYLPTGAMRMDAGGAARLGRWLLRLAAIGMRLGQAIGRVTRSAGGADGVDLTLAWALVARAMRWTRALQARLAAEAAAAELMAAEVPEPLFDRPDWDADMAEDLDDWADDRDDWARDRDDWARELDDWRDDGWAARGRRTDDGLEGRSAAEVVAQICADLSEAAALLGESEAAAEVAGIAEAARAMLGGVAAPTRVDAGSGVSGAWDAAAAAGDAATPRVATGPGAPDSG